MMNNCQQCNFVNLPNARFCNNCGVPLTNAAPDPPPTVFAAPMPPVNQPNDFQNQPNMFQNQPDFGAQNPPGYAAPKKSNLSKFLLIGGIIGLIFVGVAGSLLYAKVIKPYLFEREIAKRERDKELKAKSKTVTELLPESVTRNGQTANRVRLFDKSAILETIQKELPPLSSDLNNIEDAAAGAYVTADKRAASLQIFKFNSTQQAKNACQRIGQEMNRNKNNFVSEPFVITVDNVEGTCGASGDLKNGQYVHVGSSYGFLSVSSGYKDFAQELAIQVQRKLNP